MGHNMSEKNIILFAMVVMIYVAGFIAGIVFNEKRNLETACSVTMSHNKQMSVLVGKYQR